MYLEAPISAEYTLRASRSFSRDLAGPEVEHSTARRGGVPNSSGKSTDPPKIPCVAAPLGEIRLLPPERISPSLPVHLASRDRSSILFPTLRYAYDAPFPAPSRRGHGHAPSRLTPSQRRLPPLSSPLIARCFAFVLRVASPRRVPNDLQISLEGHCRQIPAKRRRIATTLSPTQSHGRRTLGRAGRATRTHDSIVNAQSDSAIRHRPTIRATDLPFPLERRNRPPPHRSCSTDPFRPAIIHRCS